MRRTCFVRRLALAAALLLGACESSSLLPEDQPLVNNVADRFEFEAVSLENVSDDVRYFWPVTGLPVDIDVTSRISGGAAVLQFRDGSGEVVYSEPVRNAVDATVEGQVGLWQIDVVLTEASGSFAFTAARRP